jgi:26S proteasome regulatory subunit T3
VPLVIDQFMEMVDGNNGIIDSTTGSKYYVPILSTINCELFKPSMFVTLHHHSNTLINVLSHDADLCISLLGSTEKPNITYNVSLFKDLGSGGIPC